MSRLSSRSERLPAQGEGEPRPCEGTPSPPPSPSGRGSIQTEPENEPATGTSRALVRTEEDGWLGRLAGGVVHELKNPLSTIHLNLELLRDEWARAWAHSADARERRSLKRLDVILRETRRLDAMLKDFLRFTRADRVTLEPIDLARLVDEVVAFVAPECAMRRIEVRREYDATLGPIEADPALLKQAVLNLVQNAQDAMAERGGSLTVRVARSEDGRESRIEVADTGTGIAAGDMPHLFELYRTTKPDGTGLGLATTKRIAEAHGGRIEVESVHGAGSRFILAIPARPIVAAVPG